MIAGLFHLDLNANTCTGMRLDMISFLQFKLEFLRTAEATSNANG